jgi:hypothetical protein
MSGWENVPDEAPSRPPSRRKRRSGPSIAEPEATSSDVVLVEDGRFAQLVDLYWPHAWMTMLAIVCAIGVYSAIGKLPNHPSWWP